MLRWWDTGDNSEVEQNEGPPVSVQGRVNEGGLGQEGQMQALGGLKDGAWGGGRQPLVLGHVLSKGWASALHECEDWKGTESPVLAELVFMQ